MSNVITKCIWRPWFLARNAFKTWEIGAAKLSIISSNNTRRLQWKIDLWTLKSALLGKWVLYSTPSICFNLHKLNNEVSCVEMTKSDLYMYRPLKVVLYIHLFTFVYNNHIGIPCKSSLNGNETLFNSLRNTGSSVCKAPVFDPKSHVWFLSPTF